VSIMYEIFLVNFWVIKICVQSSYFNTFKKFRNLKTLSKNLVFPSHVPACTHNVPVQSGQLRAFQEVNYHNRNSKVCRSYQHYNCWAYHNKHSTIFKLVVSIKRLWLYLRHCLKHIMRHPPHSPTYITPEDMSKWMQ